MISFLKKEWKLIVIIILNLIFIIVIILVLLFTLNDKKNYKANVDDNEGYKFKTSLKVDYGDQTSQMKVKNQGGLTIWFIDSSTPTNQIGGGEKYKSEWTEDDEIWIYSYGNSYNTKWKWEINYENHNVKFDDEIIK